MYNIIKHIFRISKNRFSYLKTVIKFLKKIKVDIIYIVTAFHNFIIIHLLQDEKDIYDRKNSEDKKSENIDNNQNKDETTLLPSDILFMNYKRDIII